MAKANAAEPDELAPDASAPAVEPETAPDEPEAEAITPPEPDPTPDPVPDARFRVICNCVSVGPHVFLCGDEAPASALGDAAAELCSAGAIEPVE